MRLDLALVARGLCDSRAKAQDAIQNGMVQVNQCIITKNSFVIDDSDTISISTPKTQFVSRAGYKLYDVLEPFGICLKDRIVLDVGASTGGFSDVCLREGARFVYAVDVGRDQLHPSLRGHPRLCNMEQINCRYLRKDMFELPIDFACIDVSFISLRLILPSVLSCMRDVELAVLVKPQFEAGKDALHKGGIVRDPKVHVRVLREFHELVQSLGCAVHHIRKSSIQGRDGNQEYIFHIRKELSHKQFDYQAIYKETIKQR